MAIRSMRRERVSPIDTAWLRMDTTGNLMMIVGVMVLGPGFDFARLRSVVTNAPAQLPPLSLACRHLRRAPGGKKVEPDLDQHLVRIGLPGKGSKQDLEHLVAQLASKALGPCAIRSAIPPDRDYAGGPRCEPQSTIASPTHRLMACC